MSSRDELTEEQATAASSVATTNTNTNIMSNTGAVHMQSSYPCEPPSQTTIHVNQSCTAAPATAAGLSLVSQDVPALSSKESYNYKNDDKLAEDSTAEQPQHQLVQAEEYISSNEHVAGNEGGAAEEKEEEDAHFLAVERTARDVLERIATREEDVELHMNEYVTALQAYRALCQTRAMYKEAHLLHQVLRHLRLEEETRHVRGLTEQQMQARRALEEQHRALFKSFHQRWNEQIDAFEEQQLEQEATLLERQNGELARFHEEMRGFNPRILRYSRALIHTRTKQFTLVRQREYLQAQSEKIKGDAQEEIDLQKFAGVKTTMYERREAALLHRHAQEMVALRMKIEGRRHYLERMRKRELDELLQRYINARRELECQQNVIRSKTTTMLMKHACNTKTDTSASAMLIASAASGAFGTSVQRRLAAESQNNTIMTRTHSKTLDTREVNNNNKNNAVAGIEGATAATATGSMDDSARASSRHQLLIDALYPTNKAATTLTTEL